MLNKPFNPVLCPVCVDNNLESRMHLTGTHITTNYTGWTTIYNKDGTTCSAAENFNPTTHVHDLINETGEWRCTYNHSGTYVKHEKCKIFKCEFGIGPRFTFTLN